MASTIGEREGYIDALRGLAILLVVLVHSAQTAGLGEQFAFGARGVQLFFVVSALTLTASWDRRGDGAGAFFVRRFARIAPMWWVSMLLWWPMIGSQSTGWDLFWNGVLLHGVWFTALESAVPGGWSVGTEVAFYLLFPALAFIIRSKIVSVVSFALSILLSTWWLQHRSEFMSEPFGFLFILAQLPAFCGGVMIFRLLPLFPVRNKWSGNCLIVFGSAWTFQVAATDGNDLGAASAALAIIVLGFSIGGGRFVVRPLLRRFGQLSYSIYLLHWFFLNGAYAVSSRLDISPSLHLALLLSAVLPVALFVCGATERFIERPGIKLGRWLLARRINRNVVSPSV